MQDKIEKIRESIIHHGTFNNRIYLLKLAPADSTAIIRELDALARREGYTKIFAKIQSDVFPVFLANGYTIEGYVPGFFSGQSDCLMVAKFTDNERSNPPVEELQRFNDLLVSFNPSGNGTKNHQGEEYKSGKLGEEDIQSVTEVFKHVFETYPFPVHDAGYILKTMRDNTALYFGIWDGPRLIGVSTAETNWVDKNTEMTDFAVLPEYRGQNLASRLLVIMEQEMKTAGIKTAYTIARLKELGMNKTFMKSGYKYTGTLVNNTNIGGSIESMNIFYKKL